LRGKRINKYKRKATQYLMRKEYERIEGDYRGERRYSLGTALPLAESEYQ
jgi:hypothetical protein